MEERKVIVFNEGSPSAWQTHEDIQVMVSNRDGKDANIFCAAKDVKLGDNIWGHNIVESMKMLDYTLNINYHYGPVHK